MTKLSKIKITHSPTKISSTPQTIIISFLFSALFVCLFVFFFLKNIFLSYSNQKSNYAFLFFTFGWNRKREVTEILWCGIKRWSNMKEIFGELMLFHSMYKRRKKINKEITMVLSMYSWSSCYCFLYSKNNCRFIYLLHDFILWGFNWLLMEFTNSLWGWYKLLLQLRMFYYLYITWLMLVAAMFVYHLLTTLRHVHLFLAFPCFFPRRDE